MIWFLVTTTGALVLVAVAERLVAPHHASFRAGLAGVPVRVCRPPGALVIQFATTTGRGRHPTDHPDQLRAAGRSDTERSAP